MGRRTLLRVVERILEVADFVVAVPQLVYAGLAVLLALGFGLYALGDPKAVGTAVETGAMAVALGVPGALCVAAGLAMHWRTPWRWWVQLALFPAYFLLWTRAFCLGQSGVSVGGFTICGR